MTILDRYFAKRLFGVLIRILLSFVLMFILVDLLTHRQDEILKYDIPLRIVGLYYLAYIPTILFGYQCAALAMLVAGLMVLGRAAQDQEITAALSGGISLRRIASTPIVFALILAVTAFAVEDTLGVRATARVKEIERRYFSNAQQGERRGVSWANLGGQWTCHILKFNRRALTGEDVYVHALLENEGIEIRARRIFWDEDRRQWLLEDGRWVTYHPKQEWEQQVIRITQAAAPFTEPPEELFALEQHPDTKPARVLARDIQRAQAIGMPVEAHLVDYHVKFARPALCFIIVFLAIPFAMRLGRGGIAVGFSASIAIGLAYLLIFLISVGLGHLGMLPPLLAAWLPNVVFGAVGIQLLRKTPT